MSDLPIPYGKQSIDESDVAAVTAVLRSDWLTTGPAVTGFERDLQAVVGAPVVAVTSGTAALHVAYAAAGVGPGAEVVTSPMTFVATAATAMLLGAEVVFADVDPATANLDPESVAAAMSDRTVVITAVDYAGQPADLPALRSIAEAAGCLLMEDAAHSLGSRWNGQSVGTLADLTTFSFFPTKNLTTAEGGAVAAMDPALLERARRFRNHGLVRDPDDLRRPGEGGWHQEVHSLGLNYRMPDVLAALGRSQLRRLESFKRRRAEIAARYDAALSGIDGLRTPTCRREADPMWHLYALRVLEGRRAALYDYLRAAEILVQVNYLPVYLHPVFEDRGYRRGLCPVAEEFYAQQLSLPLFPGMTDAQVDRVITTVRRFFGV